jgi:hypothetical protein
MLCTKLYVLHKLHVNGESPNPVQYSALNREKCENLKSLKFNHNIEILKQYFKIFAYEHIWELLTPNILSLCRDDIISDGPPLIYEVVSF